MEKQNNIAATPDTARVSPAPVSPPVQVSFRTDQFPAWMNRHQTWIVSVVSVMTLVALLGMGWAAYRVQHGLIQSSGHSLVQAATDAASRLDMMILERYSDIQLLATTPMAQGQNPEALTKYLHELVQAHPAYRWIGVTDSRGRIIATTDTPTSRDRSQSHWFQLARTITGVKILDAQVSEESRGATAITVIAPLRSPDGRFLGAITAVVGIPSLMHILDDTMLVLKNIEWTEESHIEYQLLNEKGDLIADSTMQQDGNFNLKQLGLPSAVLVGSNARGFVEETHHRRKTSVHRNHRSGHEVRRVGGEQYDHALQVLVRAQPSQRRVFEYVLFALIDHPLGHLAREYARRDGVHVDVVLAPLARQ